MMSDEVFIFVFMLVLSLLFVGAFVIVGGFAIAVVLSLLVVLSLWWLCYHGGFAVSYGLFFVC